MYVCRRSLVAVGVLPLRLCLCNIPQTDGQTDRQTDPTRRTPLPRNALVVRLGQQKVWKLRHGNQEQNHLSSPSVKRMECLPPQPNGMGTSRQKVPSPPPFSTPPGNLTLPPSPNQPARPNPRVRLEPPRASTRLPAPVCSQKKQPTPRKRGALLRPKTDDESAAASGWSGINDPPPHPIAARRRGVA